jgi:hypothetical protein
MYRILYKDELLYSLTARDSEIRSVYVKSPDDRLRVASEDLKYDETRSCHDIRYHH